jgi:hypothetical protein
MSLPEFNEFTASMHYASEHALMNEALAMLVTDGWCTTEAFTYILRAHHSALADAKDICLEAKYLRSVEGFKSLSIRKTHKYVGEYTHLDDWETVGLYRVISQRDLQEADEVGFDETRQYEMVVWVKPLKREALPDIPQIKQALRSEFTHNGCACEHDCCGCISTRVGDVEDIGGGCVFKFIMSVTPNY